jgi:hypothetical protein
MAVIEKAKKRTWKSHITQTLDEEYEINGVLLLCIEIMTHWVYLVGLYVGMIILLGIGGPVLFTINDTGNDSEILFTTAIGFVAATYFVNLYIQYYLLFTNDIFIDKVKKEWVIKKFKGNQLAFVLANVIAPAIILGYIILQFNLGTWN